MASSVSPPAADDGTEALPLQKDLITALFGKVYLDFRLHLQLLKEAGEELFDFLCAVIIDLFAQFLRF